MKTSLAESQALAKLADILYPFLPGSGAIYTWKEAAISNGVGPFWIGGSKLPAITHLLEATYEQRRDRFCDLIVTAVREGIKYRIKNKNDVTRTDISQINTLLLKLHFRVPELNQNEFLDSLPLGESIPTTTIETTTRIVSNEAIGNIHRQFLVLLADHDMQSRGYKFEKFLNELFQLHGYAPRASFRLQGEQIDGSFEWQGDTYLVEARWREKKANPTDLLALRGKTEKSDWTRGLFISVNGYSDMISENHRAGRKVNLIAMCGQDLTLILEGQWTLAEALQRKLRHAGETGEVYLPLVKAQR